jgi:hypothetical protein
MSFGPPIARVAPMTMPLLTTKLYIPYVRSRERVLLGARTTEKRIDSL